MKVVIKGDCGCFWLSTKIITRYNKLRGLPTFCYEYRNKNYRKITPREEKLGIIHLTKDFGESFDKITDEIDAFWVINSEIPRGDPFLIQTIEELEESDRLGLKIIEIPDDIEWYISELEDGREIIEEKHRIWE